MDTRNTFPDTFHHRGGRLAPQDDGTSGKLTSVDKKSLSERDVCTKFITPALRKAGWDEMTQIREEVSFTKGRITVRGKLASRSKGSRADYVLYYKPNVPIALIEAKDNTHAIGDGMQLAGHADRPDRHAQGDPLRLQYRLLRSAGIHLLVEAGDPRRIPGTLQDRQGPHRSRRRMQAGYRSPIPKRFHWRSWAADPEGITKTPISAFAPPEIRGRCCESANHRNRRHDSWKR